MIGTMIWAYFAAVRWVLRLAARLVGIKGKIDLLAIHTLHRPHTMDGLG